MLKINLIVVGLLMLSCLSTVAEATTTSKKLSKNSGELLLTQLTQSGRQQEAFARDSNTLHLQLYEEERQRRDKKEFLSLVSELGKKRDYVGFGNLLYSRGYIDMALNAFDDAIRINPSSSTAYFGRALIRDDRKDFAGALADFDKAIELNPENGAGSYYNRALIKKKTGNRSGAIQDFRRAAQLYRSVGNPNSQKAVSQLESLGARE
jgi:tetratricopeptide (TPR) repeat protein